MSALFLAWYRQSAREARRVDRQLDREERALSRQDQGTDDRAQDDDSPQEVGVSGATMQPLPADTRIEE